MSRIVWNHEERQKVSAEAMKVAAELNLTPPLKDDADLIRCMALGQRVLPGERQHRIAHLWDLQANLRFMRSVGLVKGKTGRIENYFNPRKPERTPRRQHAGGRPVLYTNGELKIDSGIPIPKIIRTRADYIKEMKVGDSIFFAGGNVKKARAAIEQSFYHSLGTGRFEGHAVKENEVEGLRVWRIK